MIFFLKNEYFENRLSGLLAISLMRTFLLCEDLFEMRIAQETINYFL